MDTLEDYEQLYEDITELNYTAFFEDYEYETDIDEYLLKVDISYRIEYMRFPIGDPEMETRLDSCLLYTSPSPRDRQKSRMPSSA